MHDPSLQGCRQWDFLHFCLEVAEQLIGNFHFWQRNGHTPRPENAPLYGLDKQLGRRIQKFECVVCSAKRVKQQLARSEMRHESCIKCSHCNMHLCISKDRNCFSKYYTMECF